MPEVGLGGLVLGGGVARFPRLQGERKLDDLSVDPVVARQVLAAHNALLGGEGGLRRGRRVRCQVRPRVGRGCHLAERSEGEAPGVGLEHGRRKLPRGVQRQAVFGERRRRPQLAPALEGAPAAVAEVDEPVPVVGVGQAIDLPHELVEITELDQLLVAQTNGQG